MSFRVKGNVRANEDEMRKVSLNELRQSLHDSKTKLTGDDGGCGDGCGLW